MKFVIFFALLVVLVGSLEASKKGKEEWKEKKMGQDMEMKVYDKKDDVGPLPDIYKPKMHTKKMKHYFGKKFFKKNKKARKMRKLKKSRKAMDWLSLRSDVECELMCKPYEVCISSPVMPQPICMHKKELKKSMKFLHKFHKKDIKAWKKHQKKMHKAAWKQNEEKYGKLSQEELDAMKRKKIEKLGKFDHHNKKEHKKEKHHYKHRPKYTEPVCGSNEFGQMKTRMMAWFHLLHGQDHDARKAHGGSIAKFYKHVSVKKELREYNGEHCQCMKSAMWQFGKMDQDQNDLLSDKELTLLEENSLEPCMRPYLQSCDMDGDKLINSKEWCCCFSNASPPCYKKLKELKKSKEQGSYLPRCDKEGYFMLEQCKGESEESRVCWCVDQNGNEYKDTAKKGRAHCHKIDKFAYNSKKLVPLV